MPKKLPILLALSLSAASLLNAQLGGRKVYAFLDLPVSARITALGGSLISVQDDDANLAYANPALLNPSMHQQIGFNYNFLVDGVGSGYASYAHAVEKWRTTFHGGIQFANYGTFDLTDEFGANQGIFKAADYAVVLGAGFQAYDRLTVGANLKWVTSRLESYNSMGLLADLAFTYRDTAKNLTFSLVMHHIGGQLTAYREGNFEPVPFEMQLGLSKKLEHLPFRFSIIYHHFDQWSIRYDDPSAEDETIFFGDVQTEQSPTAKFFDNFFRHFIFSGEFLLGKRENFRLRFGYNHLMRKELSIENLRSLAGFTFGAGIKVNRFRIDFGRTNYHLAGGATQLSIATNFQEFR
ncbi:MAG: type IX secretion system protein PorQ [Lewinellaceae bacterium]|nr:type IX secretion system protein PorQ [Lewinellaceae bacterium]